MSSFATSSLSAHCFPAAPPPGPAVGSSRTRAPKNLPAQSWAAPTPPLKIFLVHIQNSHDRFLSFLFIFTVNLFNTVYTVIIHVTVIFVKPLLNFLFFLFTKHAVRVLKGEGRGSASPSYSAALKGRLFAHIGKLALVKRSVEPALCQQLFVVAGLHNVAVPHHQDQVRPRMVEGGAQ